MKLKLEIKERAGFAFSIFMYCLTLFLIAISALFLPIFAIKQFNKVYKSLGEVFDDEQGFLNYLEKNKIED